jgi:hypothetical protein
MKTFRVTAEWLHAHTGKAGGFNRKQLAVLGVPWPPKKGWLWLAEGTWITEEQRQHFEQLKTHVTPLIPGL